MSMYMSGWVWCEDGVSTGWGDREGGCVVKDKRGQHTGNKMKDMSMFGQEKAHTKERIVWKKN